MRYILLLLLLQGILPPQSKAGTPPDTLRGFVMDKGVKSVIIPIKIIHNLILVPIRINNSIPVDFILDTGVSATILTEPVWADILGLRYTDKINLRGLGGGEPLQADVAHNVRCSLPNLSNNETKLVVLPPGALSFSEMFGQSVYGIIGYDLFRAFTIEINYAGKYLVIYRPDAYKVRPKMTAIPLAIFKGKPYIAAQISSDSTSKQTLNLLIDTGSSQALSLLQTGKQDSIIAAPTKKVSAYLGKGLNGDINGYIARLEQLQIAQFSFDKPIACFPDSMATSLQIGNVPWQGSIGGDLLQRFKCVFDYKNKKLYLKKNSRYNKLFMYNISGIEINTMGMGKHDRFVINHIRAGSISEQMGVQVGDELLAINGNALQNLSIDAVYDWLQQKSGSQLNLKIRRNDAILRYQLPLQDEL
jgi:hypothetical protein